MIANVIFENFYNYDLLPEINIPISLALLYPYNSYTTIHYKYLQNIVRPLQYCSEAWEV